MNAINTAKLYNWLNKDHETVRNTIAVKLAKQATLALGFPISQAQITTLRREMGLSKPNMGRPGARSPLMQQITKHQVMLAQEVEEIRKQLGLPISKPLQDLARA